MRAIAITDAPYVDQNPNKDRFLPKFSRMEVLDHLEDGNLVVRVRDTEKGVINRVISERHIVILTDDKNAK